MRPDNFSDATKKLIASRSGFVCAYPDCYAPTSGPSEDGKSVNVGEAAHITSASPDGPRYDPTMSSEDRRSEENGIWMCRTHAALIDRDLTRFTVEYLRQLKYKAEDSAMRALGKPQGCATCSLGTASPAVRIGADYRAIVDGVAIPYTFIIDPSVEGLKLTWFVSALVVQFTIAKKHTLKHVVIEHIAAFVHETKPIPKYRPVSMAYPVEVSLYYIDLDINSGTGRREFRATRFYELGKDGGPETESFPPSIVIDNDVPAQIAVRFNAKVASMYLVELVATLSSGDERETLCIMPPQWMIFEPVHDDYDPLFGA